MELFRYKRSFKKALIWAAVAILTLYRNRDSITYPIFMLATLGILAWDAKSMGKSLIKNIEGKIDIKLFYCIGLLLLSINKCMTASVGLQWGNGLGILLLFSCLLLKLYSNQEDREITTMLIKLADFFIVPLANIAKPFTDSAAAKQAKAMAALAPDQAVPDETGKKTFKSIMIGLLVAIPLLWIIIALLASADMVFGDMVDDILGCIKLPKLDEDWIGVPFKFFISFLAFYTWTACLPAENFYQKKEGKKLDAVVAITFNSLIALVYLLFSGIQFAFLVMKMSLPEGMTYAEYAHEGFYQLLAVTILNLALVSFCKKHFADNKVLKALLVVISLSTYVMIASSAVRMYLYVGVYGLSHLRVYVLWLLVVLTVWTTLLIVGIYKEGINYFRIITVFVTVWYLIFAFSFPDRWIVSYDLGLTTPPNDIRYEEYPDAADIIRDYGDEKIWKTYTSGTSYLITEYNDKNILQRVREFNFAEDKGIKIINQK